MENQSGEISKYPFPNVPSIASSFNVILEKYKISRARTFVRQSLFDLQTQQLKQNVNIA